MLSPPTPAWIQPPFSEDPKFSHIETRVFESFGFSELTTNGDRVWEYREKANA